MEPETRDVPLYGYVDGRRQVVGYTVIDAEDFDRVNVRRWHVNDGKYIASTFGRGLILLHRFILNAPPQKHVDHKNRNGFDNRKINLRFVTNAENAQNIGARGKSAFRGVHFRPEKNRWEAQVYRNRKRVFQKLFVTETEAAEAARLARARFLTHAVD